MRDRGIKERWGSERDPGFPQPKDLDPSLNNLLQECSALWASVFFSGKWDHSGASLMRLQ